MNWSRTNQLILAAAARLGVEAEAIAREHSDFFMRLRWPGAPGGPRAVIISKTRSPFLTQVAQTLANNKFIARELLAAQGLPVVEGLLLDEAADPAASPEAAARVQAFLRAHGRVVVKPNWGNRGIGVLTDLRVFPAVVAAYGFARELDRDEEVVLEPYIAGVDLRVAVIGGRYAAAAELRRPQLRGDGRHSAAQLLAQLNADPRRGSWDAPSLAPLDRIDPATVEERLAVDGADLQTILGEGERVELCFEELEIIDRSEELHPGWVAAALAAARLLGVDVAGVDLRGEPSELFGAPPSAGARARILEVNALPALHLHALATHGQARPVFEDFVAYCLQLPGAPEPCSAVLV